MVHRPAMGKARPWMAVVAFALVAFGFVVGVSVGSARRRPTHHGDEPATTAMLADRGSVGIHSTGPFAGQQAIPPATACATRAHVADAGVQPDRGQTFQRADRLVDLLKQRVGTLPPAEAHANGVEGVANATDEYLRGWADALEAGAPELLNDTAHEIERELCDGSLTDAQTIVYLRFVLREAATRGPVLDRGLRCVLGRRTQEDVVLWTALEAWSKSDLAAAPEWAAWAARATDPRTRRRLGTWSARGDRESPQMNNRIGGRP